MNMVGKGSFDRVLAGLSHPYRRQLLLALTEHNPQVVEDGLDAEHALDSVDGGVEQTGDVHVWPHLSILEEFGYIRTDRATGHISKGPKWPEIEPTVSILQDHETELPADWLTVPDDVEDEAPVTPELLWTLADESNRRVLQYFAESSANSVEVADLTAYVAEHHEGIFEGNRAKTKIHLHHKSLPQLAEQEIIEYDNESGVVRKSQSSVVPASLMDHVLALDEG